jgi:hypothetical protein
VSPAYVIALKAGQLIRELLDWAQKILCSGRGEENRRNRLIEAHQWIENKASAPGVTFPIDTPKTKEEWLVLP